MSALLIRSAACAAIFALIPASGHAAQVGLCKFDTVQFAFAGTSLDQASCLLRFVKNKGTGSTPQQVPPWLSDRVGKPTGIAPASLQAVLEGAGVSANDIGGPIPAEPDVSEKRYFVIHDTSAPELTGIAAFPANINSADWSGNSLNGWADTALRVNVITNRTGSSRTLWDFTMARPKPATKLEQDNLYVAAKKYFLHAENIQPRIKPAGSWGYIAPDPGFPPAQIERLALVYLAASVRAGHWLIPAFHFNIDDGLATANGHDDPQAFVLADWVAAVERLASKVVPTQ